MLSLSSRHTHIILAYMELRISNFAKIEDASILIDGITVVAGLNNTGKSTIGKILFAIFNSLYNIEEKIDKQRKEAVQRRIESIISQDAIFGEGQDIRFRYSMLSYQIADAITDAIWEISNHGSPPLQTEIESIISSSFADFFQKRMIPINLGEIQNKAAKCIVDTLSLPEQNVKKIIATSYFNAVFDGQINPVGEEHSCSTLDLFIKNKKTHFSFCNDECIELETPLTINHQALLLDTPFVIDILQDTLSNRRFHNLERNPKEELLVRLLYQASSPMRRRESAFETSYAKVLLQEIEERVSSVIPGHFVIEKRTPSFHFIGDKETVSLKNTSLGVKSFLILKLLLEAHSIKDKDVLILDEPEIHLHPQWQIVYAEIIVLLQKYFNLSILITTHSPYFLDAINLYTKKHGLNNPAHYYISQEQNSRVSIKDVTGKLSSIYKMMASPLDILDNLRDEIESM